MWSSPTWFFISIQKNNFDSLTCFWIIFGFGFCIGQKKMNKRKKKKFIISVASLCSDLLTNLTTITTPITLAITLSACKITRHSVQKHMYIRKKKKKITTHRLLLSWWSTSRPRRTVSAPWAGIIVTGVNPSGVAIFQWWSGVWYTHRLKRSKYTWINRYPWKWLIHGTIKIFFSTFSVEIFYQKKSPPSVQTYYRLTKI